MGRVKDRAAVLDITPIDKAAQPSLKRFPKKPSAISALYSLRDLEELGITWYQVYKAAEEGRLHALRRHKRLFYAEHEVRAAFEIPLAEATINRPRRLADRPAAKKRQGPLAWAA